MSLLVLAATAVPEAAADSTCTYSTSDVAVRCDSIVVQDPVLGKEVKTQEFCVGDVDFCDDE